VIERRTVTSRGVSTRPARCCSPLLTAALGLLMPGMLPVDAHAATPKAAATRLPGCEAWIGDFATKPATPSFIRIERSKSGFLARSKGDDGNWASDTVVLEDVTHAPDLDMPMAHGCVLAGDGFLFIKAAKGTAYQATAITGQNFGTYHMGTDSLMIVTSGFQVDGQDLYRVEAKGVSPAAPPPLAKATVGKEATSFTCPGKQAPAITQAAFDALPEDYRKYFHALPPERQAAVICGQHLDELLSLDTYTAVDLDANRAATLTEAKLLLKAGEQPRDDQGQLTWWSGARHWLMRNTPLFDTSPAIPLQAEYFTTFNEDILPRLPKPQTDDAQSVTDVARYTLGMPEAQAMQALTQLQALGALELPLSDSNVARATLTRAFSPPAPDPVFELLWTLAKPSQKDARALFRTAIDAGKDDTTGINRLIKHGLDPTDVDVLLAARRHPKLYPIVLGSAFKHAQAHGNKLPPEVIDPLVRATVLQDKVIDWQAVEPLLKQGGDLSRSFVNGITDDRDSLAYLARSTPDRFLDMLNHGLRVDLPYPVGGNALLTRYLRLNIGWLPEGPRPDVVEAMLKRDNNAVTGKPCTDCDFTPISIALGNRGPNSVAVVKVLMRYGVDPNSRDDRNFPYFTYAIMDDRVDMLEAMHNAKPLNLKLTDPNGFSLLAVARCYDAHQAEAWLRQHGADQPDQGYAVCREHLEQQHPQAKKEGNASP
jgi:hypothetical protein